MLIKLLEQFNFYAQGIVPDSWKDSLVIFLTKTDNKGLRTISLMSCLLKIMERCLYHRLRWMLESSGVIPDTQFGFRNFKSCGDSLTILNQIYERFIKGMSTVSVFLDVMGAFDNVIPHILIKDLKRLGSLHIFVGLWAIWFHPDPTVLSMMVTFLCQSLLQEHLSRVSPILFNIYVRESYRTIHPVTRILQYADDVVIYATEKDINPTIQFINSSLENINKFLRNRGLEVSPSKSKWILFSRKKVAVNAQWDITINNSYTPCPFR